MAESEPRTARGALGQIARKLGVVTVATSFKKTPQELVDLIGDSAGIPNAELKGLMNDLDALRAIAAEIDDAEPEAKPKDPVRGRTAAKEPEPPARGRGRAAAAEPEEEEAPEAPAPKDPVRGRGRGAASVPDSEPAPEAGARGGRGRGRATAAVEEPAPKDPVRGGRGRGRAAAAEEPPEQDDNAGGGSADLDAIYAKLDGLQTALETVREENKQLLEKTAELEARLLNVDKAAAFCVTELVFIDEKTGKPKDGAPATVSDIDDIEGYCFPG